MLGPTQPLDSTTPMTAWSRTEKVSALILLSFCCLMFNLDFLLLFKMFYLTPCISRGVVLQQSGVSLVETENIGTKKVHKDGVLSEKYVLNPTPPCQPANSTAPPPSLLKAGLYSFIRCINLFVPLRQSYGLVLVPFGLTSLSASNY